MTSTKVKTLEMKKTNQALLIYSSAQKALDHLYEVDVHPGTSQRNLDAAIQRVEDIRAIANIPTIESQIMKEKQLEKERTWESIRRTQGRSLKHAESNETFAIIAGCVTIVFIVACALYNLWAT